jgi:ribosome modulation factor
MPHQWLNGYRIGLSKNDKFDTQANPMQFSRKELAKLIFRNTWLLGSREA